MVVNNHNDTPFIFADFHLIYELLRDVPELRKRCYETRIQGYEIYIAEQWCLNREITNLIVSYTGDPSMIAHACKVYLPLDPNEWPLVLQNYYKFIEKSTRLKYINKVGYLFVSDIHDQGLVSQNLNLMPVPGGDIRQVWHNFTNNTNLRRLHCGGRLSVMLQNPSSASMDKFYQLYQISRKYIPPSEDQDTKNKTPNSDKPVFSVVELVVYLAQVALKFCNLLDTSYVDGFLCHKTERALYKWQKTYGTIYFPSQIQPTKTLTPSLLSALVSLCLVCFYKFKLQNCLQQFSSVPDPFIQPSLIYTAIYHFQKKIHSKKQKLVDSTYLDIPLIDKLFQVTDDSDANEFSNLKKFVKTTMKDITASAKITGIGRSVGAGSAMFSLASTDVLTNDLGHLAKTINTYGTVFNTTTNIDFNELHTNDGLVLENRNKEEKTRNHENPLSPGDKIKPSYNKALESSAGEKSSNTQLSSSSTTPSSSRLKGHMIVKSHMYNGSLLGWLWNEHNKSDHDSFFYNDFIWFDYSKFFNPDYEYFFKIKDEEIPRSELKNQIEVETSNSNNSDLLKNLNDEFDYRNEKQDLDFQIESLRIKEFYDALDHVHSGSGELQRTNDTKHKKLFGGDQSAATYGQSDGYSSNNNIQKQTGEEIGLFQDNDIFYDADFMNELTRSVSLNDCKLIQENKIFQASRIKKIQRSHSFTTVQEYFEDFERPLSSVRFAIDFKEASHVKCQHFINNEVELTDKLTNLQSNILPFINKKYDDLKYQYESEFEAKMSMVLKQKRKLESVVSKYNYDIRLLERRMRNVTETLELFDLKTNNMRKVLIATAKEKGPLYVREIFLEGLVSLEDMDLHFIDEKLASTISENLKKLTGSSEIEKKVLIQEKNFQKIKFQDEDHYGGVVFILLRVLYIIIRSVYLSILSKWRARMRMNEKIKESSMAQETFSKKET